MADDLIYPWNQQGKRIKIFVISTNRLHRKPNISKIIHEDPETGRFDDIDLVRMRQEFIVKYTHEDEDCEYFVNKTKVQFLERLKKLQSKLLQEYDCFFFMFFTFSVDDVVEHEGKRVGEERLHFADGALSINKIWDEVKQVKGFHDKPKVFLIQSDNPSLLYPDQRVKAGGQDFEYERLSVDADRLIIQSTLPVQYARKLDGARPTPRGSFLVQAFLEVMERNRSKPSENQLDLLSLTCAINGNVKRKIKELEKMGEKYASYLTPPQVTSTFTKLLFL